MAIREHLFLAPCVRATGGEGGRTQVYPNRIKKRGLLNLRGLKPGDNEGIRHQSGF